jgi:hypothetical protein
MNAETFPEPEALRATCQAVQDRLNAAGPWLSPDDPVLTDLAGALKAYFLQTRRMYRLSKTRDGCLAMIETCDRMNAEVRRSVMSALQTAASFTGDRLDTALPLMETLTQTAEAVNKLTNESSLKVRVTAMRALEDACLKLLDAVSDPEQAGEEPAAPAEEPKPEAAKADGAAPARDKPNDSKEMAAAKPPSDSGPVDGKPIPRLPVAKLLEFLGGQTLPEGAAALAGWPERNPDDTMPNSWIQPGSCPICTKDVLVAFGKSRKETIFCQAGHVLKFNQAQALVGT